MTRLAPSLCTRLSRHCLLISICVVQPMHLMTASPLAAPPAAPPWRWQRACAPLHWAQTPQAQVGGWMGVWGSCDAAKGPQPLLSLPLLLPQLRPDASAVLGFQTMSLPPCFPGSPLPLPAGYDGKVRQDIDHKAYMPGGACLLCLPTSLLRRPASLVVQAATCLHATRAVAEATGRQALRRSCIHRASSHRLCPASLPLPSSLALRCLPPPLQLPGALTTTWEGRRRMTT